jgi:hypothetical protein
MLSKAIAPLLLSTAAAVTVTVGKQSSSNGCDALSKSVPNTIFYRGDDVYKYENTQFWSNNELMDPECVFRPSSADEVAQAVQIMQDTNTQFAVRGGGHMAIRVCAFSYTYASMVHGHGMWQNFPNMPACPNSHCLRSHSVATRHGYHVPQDKEPES